MDDLEKISVLVATYNPGKHALEMTLRSILAQRNCIYEIIITDDCSKEDYFEYIQQFFKECDFSDYKLVKNQINVGTVKNALNGLKHCNGMYVKPIGPGDCLYGENTLALWKRNMDYYGAVLSFSDTVAYKYREDDGIEIISVPAYPFDVSAYSDGGERLRESYLLRDNKCMGVSTLIKREVFERYLSMIENKVKYCEDFIYRLMIYNREPVSWFDNSSMLYEYGTGISTKGEGGWDRIIRRDWLEANKILKGWIDTNDPFDRKLLTLINAYNDEEVKLKNKVMFYSKNLSLVFERILIYLHIKKRRMSPIDKKVNFIAIIEGKQKLC